VPILGVEVVFLGDAPKKLTCEPGGVAVESRREEEATVVKLPPLELHYMLVGEDV
jgi:hypothetical protein